MNGKVVVSKDYMHFSFLNTVRMEVLMWRLVLNKLGADILV